MTRPQENDKTQHCEQCGREGTRGFKTIPAVYVDWLQHAGIELFWNPAIIVCAAEKACRLRWPRSLERVE